MTKLRQPLTFEHALTRIAGVIGWDQVSRIAGQAERTVRNWSDPDTGPSAEDMSIGTALRLDVAYRAAGGDGAPMRDCYALRFDTAIGALDPCLDELALRISESAAEDGEAIAAAIRAMLPRASDAELARAVLEVQEAIDAKKSALEALTALRDKRRQAAPERVS